MEKVDWRIELLRLIGVFAAGMSLVMLPVFLLHPILKEVTKGGGLFFLFLMGVVLFTEVLETISGKHAGKLKSTLIVLFVGLLMGVQLFFYMK